MVATTAVVASRAFVRQNCLALKQEVASCSDPCPWSEEREDPAMDQMSTIVVKHERREQKPPS
jgi:hypothetical protein